MNERTKKTRITVNGFSARQGGGQTYLINLIRYLPEEAELTLLCGYYNRDLLAKAAEGRRNVNLVTPKFAGHNPITRTLWELFALPGFLRRNRSEIYYAAGGLMLTRMPRGCRSATALRNMLPFDDHERKRFPFFSYLRFKLLLLRPLFLLSYHLADRVVFISAHSFECVRTLYPRVVSKAAVIPHGLNEQFHSDTQPPFDFKAHQLEQGQFYLYVSILDAYKAQKEVVREWKTLVDNGFQYPLVLAGPRNNRYAEETAQLIRELEMEDKVRLLGPVKYASIPGLYAGARALIFASSCECCPNILLEKMSAGKPLYCSDIPPMPEFGGPDVVYFSPYRPGALAQAVQEGEEHFAVRQEAGRRLHQRSLDYDWRKCIARTLAFLTGN